MPITDQERKKLQDAISAGAQEKADETKAAFLKEKAANEARVKWRDSKRQELLKDDGIYKLVRSATASGKTMCYLATFDTWVEAFDTETVVKDLGLDAYMEEADVQEGGATKHVYRVAITWKLK